MKTTSKNMVPIMAVLIAITVGTTFAVTYTTTLQTLVNTPPSAASSAFMTGHVQAIVRDNEGVIKAYRQADNAIVTGGLTVLADQLFQEYTFNALPLVAGQNNHTNTTGGRFGWMNIGNGTSSVNATDTGLECPLELGYGGACGTGGARATCTGEASEIWNSKVSFRHPNDAGVPNNVAQINVTAIATFDGADCFSNAIREAALWNNATSPAPGPNGQMFARNTFGSVTLTPTDSLELTWRFTFTDQ